MSLRPVADLHLAAVFLTRLPLPRLPADPPPLAAVLWAFPLVGAGIGLIAGAVLAGAAALGLPATVGALLAVAAAAWMTGGLHEDGLADVADGFGGGTTRDRKLEILRDSRIGSYGVLALALAIGLKAAALAAIVDPLAAVAALVAAGALGRAVVPGLMIALPAARTDGLGHGAGRPSTGMAAGTAGLAVAVAALALLPPWSVALAVGAAVAAGAVVAALARRHIGGHTGDVLGAAVLTAEVAVLVVVSGGS